jgi:hypothetical protein
LNIYHINFRSLLFSVLTSHFPATYSAPGLRARLRRRCTLLREPLSGVSPLAVRARRPDSRARPFRCTSTFNWPPRGHTPWQPHPRAMRTTRDSQHAHRTSSTKSGSASASGVMQCLSGAASSALAPLSLHSRRAASGNYRSCALARLPVPRGPHPAPPPPVPVAGSASVLRLRPRS